MLILSRKEGQRLMVGDNIVVSIEKIKGGMVAIGIEAQEVPVDREEVRRRKREGRAG